MKQAHGMKASNVALLLSSLLRLTVVYRLHLNIPSGLPLFAGTFGLLLPIVFHTAFIFMRNNIALLSWRYFMAAEIP